MQNPQAIKRVLRQIRWKNPKDLLQTTCHEQELYTTLIIVFIQGFAHWYLICLLSLLIVSLYSRTLLHSRLFVCVCVCVCVVTAIGAVIE